MLLVGRWLSLLSGGTLFCLAGALNACTFLLWGCFRLLGVLVWCCVFSLCFFLLFRKCRMQDSVLILLCCATVVSGLLFCCFFSLQDVLCVFGESLMLGMFFYWCFVFCFTYFLVLLFLRSPILSFVCCVSAGIIVEFCCARSAVLSPFFMAFLVSRLR